MDVELDVVTKEIMYYVYNNHKEVLKVSDLDIAIQKLNEL